MASSRGKVGAVVYRKGTQVAGGTLQESVTVEVRVNVAVVKTGRRLSAYKGYLFFL